VEAMMLEIKGELGIRFEVVGWPWNRKKFGPPYLRIETCDGKYLGSPKYRDLKKLQKMIELILKCEVKADGRKGPRRSSWNSRTGSNLNKLRRKNEYRRFDRERD
jgi:hypothetical protein